MEHILKYGPSEELGRVADGICSCKMHRHNAIALVETAEKHPIPVPMPEESDRSSKY